MPLDRIVRERPVSALTSIFLGFLLPLGLVLAAAGVNLGLQIRLVVLLCLVALIGATLISLLRLERIATSTLGAFTLAAFLGLGTMALIGQLLGAISDRRYAWMICFTPVIAVILLPSQRAKLTESLGGWGRTNPSEVTALWFVIFCLLGVSARIFSFAALGLLILHFLLTRLGRRVDSGVLRYLPAGILALVVLLVSESLGWRELSAWAFAVTSADVHIFVNGSWAVDLNGWGTDPITFGVNAPYHFLAQAMAGLFARLAGISSALSVILVLPVMAAAAAYAALQSAFQRFKDVSLKTWLPSLVLLVSFSPLEPNIAMSSESFTHQISVAFLVVLLPILQMRVTGGPAINRVGVIAVAAMALSSKIFTGVTVAGILCGLVLFAVLARDVRVTKRIIADGFGTLVVVGLLSLLTYVPDSSAQLFRMELGARSLEDYWELIGGRFPGVPLALMFMFVAGSPIAVTTALFLVARRRLNLELSSWMLSGGLLVGAAGTFLLGLVTFFPPAGYAERYFITNALLLTVFVGVQLAAVVTSNIEVGGFLANPRSSPAVVLLGCASLFATARLWADRYQANPSRLSFAIGFLTPYVAVAVVMLSWFAYRRYKGSGTHLTQSSLITVGMAWAIILLSITSAASTMGYGMRGSLKSLVGVVNQEVTLADFGNELKESTDTSGPFVDITRAVKALTTRSAVVATNFDMTGQLFLSSAAERQLWWSSYTAGLARRDPVLTLHLAWRRETMEGFGTDLAAGQVQSMRACGVTHYVLHQAQPINLESVLPREEVTIVYSNATTAILALGAARATDRLPNPEWRRWCGNQPADS